MGAQERRLATGLGWVAVAVLAIVWWSRATGSPPIGGPSQADTAAWDAALDAARRVDVNAAGVAELQRLPGIGPILAERIVASRTAHGRFGTLEDLRRVRGIGAKTLEALRAHVRGL